MDKYEYQLKLDQINKLADSGDYTKASKIANSIDWHRVRSVNTLSKVADVYDKTGRYDKAREILTMAYDRAPVGRMIAYRLSELCINLGDYDKAIDYYKDFVRSAPKDPSKLLLKYQIFRGKGAAIKDQIDILEEYRAQEYEERWALELAYLYEEAGEIEKCVNECDELILWFNDGQYVTKALELKAAHAPLTPAQQDKYDLRMNKVKVVDEDQEKQQAQPVGETRQQYEEGELPNIQDPDLSGEGIKIEEDGQMAMDMDDYQPVDKQITGQMTIEEILAEWEKAKHRGSIQAAAEEEKETAEEEESEEEETEIEETIADEDVDGEEEETEESTEEEEIEEEDLEEDMPLPEIAMPDFGEESEEEPEEEADEESADEEGEYTEDEEPAAEDEEAEEDLEETEDDESEEEIEEEDLEEDMPLPEIAMPDFGEESEEESEEEADEEPADEEGEYTENEEPADEEGGYTENEEPADEEGEYTENEEPADEEGEYTENEEPADEEGEYTEDEETADENEEAEEELEETEGEESEEEIEEEDLEEDDMPLPEIAMPDFGEESEEEPEEETDEEPAEEEEESDEEPADEEEADEEIDEEGEYTEDGGYVAEEDYTEEGEYVEEGEYSDDGMPLPEIDMPDLNLADEKSVLGDDIYEGEEEDEDALPEIAMPDGIEFEDEDEEYAEDDEEYADEDEEYAEDDDEYADDDEEYEDDEYSDEEKDDYSDEDEEEDDYSDEDEEEDDYSDEDEEEDDYSDEDEEEDDYSDEDEEEDDYSVRRRRRYDDEDNEDTYDPEVQIVKSMSANDLALADAEDGHIDGMISDNSIKRKRRVPDIRNFGDDGVELSEDNKKLFTYFAPVRGMSDQLMAALNNEAKCKRNGTSAVGNILVMGVSGSGKTKLAVNLVKAIQKTRKQKNGKLAKISADTLNTKDVGAVVKKLGGGALIIENASEMSDDTAIRLEVAMRGQTDELVVIFEGERQPLRRFMKHHPGLNAMFTTKIEIPIFNNDELVEFGRCYAQELDYSIDEVAVLALYNRIGNMQRDDYDVSVTDVKNIIDGAIKKNEQRGVGKFFRSLTGRKRDDEDRIILQEKDFGE